MRAAPPEAWRTRRRWPSSATRRCCWSPAYDQFREKAAQARQQRVGSPGNPGASGAAVLAVVDAEQPPLRIFFGDGPLGIATADYENRLATWQEWSQVSVEAGLGKQD